MGSQQHYKAMSTPVLVANRTLAYHALESGLYSHEIKIDWPIHSRPVRLKRCVHTAIGADLITCRLSLSDRRRSSRD